MKKYVILTIFTVLLIGASFFISNFYISKIPVVETKIITPTLVRTTVNCSGRIEERDKAEVTYEKPFVPASINVKVGDYIKKGDLLMTVDKEATQKAYVENKTAIEVFDNAPNMDFNSFNKEELLQAIDIPEEIHSTVEGVITNINAREGILDDPNKALVTVSDLSRLQVRVPVNESQISDIKIGQKATITGVGFKNEKLIGVVDSIGLVAKTPPTGISAEAFVEVLVTFDCKSRAVKPGFTAKTEIEIDKTPNMIIVPYTAVSQDEKGQEFVYIYEKGRAVRQKLTLGRELEQGYEVIKGIESGTRVITNADKIKKDKSRVILAEKVRKAG